MKISIIAPIKESVPPKKYGPIHYNIDNLAKELHRLGEDVTVYCSGDSGESIYKKIFITDKSYTDSIFDNELISKMSAQSKENAFIDIEKKDFDLVINFTGYAFAKRYKDRLGDKLVNVITWTLEDPQFAEKYINIEKTRLVVLSEFQKNYIRNAKSPVSVIYTGLNVDDFVFNPTPQDYFCFFGRIDPDKGIGDAINLAVQNKFKLKIAARIDKKFQNYFINELQPTINQNHNIEYIGEIGMDKKSDFLGNSLGLLFPARVKDALSNAVLESLACGTPVLAYDVGPISEVVKDGYNGFICSDFNGLAMACTRIKEIDRSNARKTVLEKFSVEAMAKSFIKLAK